MKTYLLTFTVFLSMLSALGQNFEGQITYKNTYKSKVPNVTDEQFSSMLGSEMNYYIKGGNYKNTSNGSFLQYQLYINTDNKLYTKFANSETIFWNDGAINTDEVLKTELNKNATEILGYKCDELILTCKSGVQRYYFNAALGIDAKLFANHKYGNWAAYLSKSNSVPLKLSVENAQFIMESVTTVIKPEILESKLFELPVGVALAKSPY